MAAIIFGIFSTALSLLAIAISVVGYRHGKNNEKAEKAHVMAKAYAELIPSFEIISSNIISTQQIQPLVNKVNLKKMIAFDTSELNSVYAQEEQRILKVYFLNNELDSLLVKTLNQLEWFSMAFIHGIADSDVVYQSLHQSYLDMVKLLYFRIAMINKSGNQEREEADGETYDKYYTNIIALYGLWRARRERDIRKSKQREKQFQKSKQRIDKKVLKSKKSKIRKKL